MGPKNPILIIKAPKSLIEPLEYPLKEPFKENPILIIKAPTLHTPSFQSLSGPKGPNGPIIRYSPSAPGPS